MNHEDFNKVATGKKHEQVDIISEWLDEASIGMVSKARVWHFLWIQLFHRFDALWAELNDINLSLRDMRNR